MPGETELVKEIANIQGILPSQMPKGFHSTLGPEVFEHLAGISDSGYSEDRLLEVPVDVAGNSLLEAAKVALFKESTPLVRKWFWPGFAPAAAIITHDIDTMNNPPAGQKVEFVKYAVARKVKGQPFNDNIQNILDVEGKYGLNASYYFFSDYGKHQEHFKKVLGQIPSNHEIALHGSQHSFQSHKNLEAEKKALEKLSGQSISGIRQHGLNFMVPHTWRYQEKVGFYYDLTHAYNDKFGFRAGICHPFHPFDSLASKRMGILEIPTSFMDWTAMHLGMDRGCSFDKVKEICQVAEDHNGVFVPIFHNMYVNEKSHPDITGLFEDTLKFVKARKYWTVTASECAGWWRARESAKITLDRKGEGYVLKSDTSLPLEVHHPGGKVERMLIEAGKELEI